MGYVCEDLKTTGKRDTARFEELVFDVLYIFVRQYL